MAKYRKKPVVVEAVQWNGDKGKLIEVFPGAGKFRLMHNNDLMIPTLEGDHRCRLGDWVIKDVKGEFYPCRPDIFEDTYEPA